MGRTAREPSWIDNGRRLGISKGLVCDMSVRDLLAALELPVAKREALIVLLGHVYYSLLSGTMVLKLSLCPRGIGVFGLTPHYQCNCQSAMNTTDKEFI